MPVPTLLTPKQIIVVSGGGNYIVISSVSGATITCGNQSYTLGSGETSHVFSVDAGTHTCTASKTDYYDATQSVTISTGQEFITLIPTYMPTAYQQIEYLKSDGNQFIITPVKNGADQVIDCKFMITRNAASQRIFGTANAETTFIKSYAGSTNIRYLAKNNAGENASLHNNPVLNVNTVYDVTLDVSADLTINGTVYANSNNYGGATTQNYIWLFSRSGDSGIALEGNMYLFKITQSGTKIIDLVPCYRKSDSVLGMWDKVSDTFLTNSGTGTFTAGPDVN